MVVLSSEALILMTNKLYI